MEKNELVDWINVLHGQLHQARQKNAYESAEVTCMCLSKAYKRLKQITKEEFDQKQTS